jgi:hypothetical protein
MRPALLAYAVLALTGILEAESNALRIPRVSRPPKLSDFIGNVPREAEAEVADFRQFDPNDGAPVSQPTKAYLSYDDRNLYVAFICFDDPAKIRARVARRKDIESDDRVTINLDTFHDHKRAYWFDVNPYAVQFDGITTDGLGDDTTFETLWYAEARILEDRYVVLETIPFRSLRFPQGPQQSWGVLLARFVQRNNEMSCWPYVSRKKLPQFVGQFADMEGLEGISPGRNLQFVPYTALSKSRYFDQAAGRYRNGHEIRGGMDAKAVLHDSLTLDVTVNPDFSQVESDEPQVTVNQRYEVFFPERRPFFNENAALFTTPEELFFSRRIADPQFGARLTGKVRRWAIAALAADDRAPGSILADSDPLAGERAIDGVVRVQREFGRQSHIGALMTDHEFGGGFNRVASLDTRVMLPHNWSIVGQGVTSFTRDPGAALSDGQALRFQVAHQTGNSTYRTIYVDRSPDFRTDLGYIERVDIRELTHSYNYRWRPGGRTLVSFGPYFEAMTNWDRTGRIQDWMGSAEFNLELVRNTNLELTREEGFERYQGIGFRKHRTVADLETQWYRWLALSLTLGSGQSINYYPAAGLLPFAANERSGEFHVTVRPTSRLRLDESYFYTRLAESRTVFNDHVVRSKTSYQFTRALSLRAIMNYHGVLPNPDLVALDRTRKLGFDVLFTYLLHPGTALYAGYSSSFENFTFNPAENPAWRRTGMPTGLDGLQLFVKLSYMFRY